MVLSWPAPSFSEGSGLACAVVPPAHPPTFLETGGLPLYPRRGLRPLHPAWGTEGRLLIWRVQTLPSLPPTTGVGTEQPPAPRLRDGGSVVACALLQWGDLGRAGIPPAPDVFLGRDCLGRAGIPPAPLSDARTGGHAVPPAGAAPPAPRLGDGGGVAFSPWRIRALPNLPPSTRGGMGGFAGGGPSADPAAPVLGAIEQAGVSVSACSRRR